MLSGGQVVVSCVANPVVVAMDTTWNDASLRALENCPYFYSGSSPGPGLVQVYWRIGAFNSTEDNFIIPYEDVLPYLTSEAKELLAIGDRSKDGL